MVRVFGGKRGFFGKVPYARKDFGNKAKKTPFFPETPHRTKLTDLLAGDGKAKMPDEKRVAKYTRSKIKKNKAILEKAIAVACPPMRLRFSGLNNDEVLGTLTEKKLIKLIDAMKRGVWYGNEPSTRLNPSTAHPETQNIIIAR